VLLSVTALKNDNQQIIGFFGIAKDITQRKQAEVKLKHINEELLRATKLKDEFLTRMRGRSWSLRP
jgi:hypothetical protein